MDKYFEKMLDILREKFVTPDNKEKVRIFIEDMTKHFTIELLRLLDNIETNETK